MTRTGSGSCRHFFAPPRARFSTHFLSLKCSPCPGSQQTYFFTCSHRAPLTKSKDKSKFRRSIPSTSTLGTCARPCARRGVFTCGVPPLQSADTISSCSPSPFALYVFLAWFVFLISSRSQKSNVAFSPQFDKMIDSADLKSTVVVGQDALEDKDLQVLYWKQLSALGLTLLKAVFFLWSCSIVAMIIEGFACQYNVPYGTSPCDCSPQMRESVVALYFMFTTGTSVGFGDFVPITELGMMLVIGFMLAAVSVVPGWGNEVLDIVSCVNQTRHARARLRRHKKHNKRVGADLYAISENPVSTTLGFASPYLETSRDDQRRMGGKSSSMLKIPKLPTSVVSPNPSARLSSMRSDNWFDAEDDDAALQQLLKRLNEDHRTMMDLVRIAKHQAEQLVAKRA
eukprot:c20164_g1_i3.p1 GENE.c20164_g1_i3~~c20164_g1_i3.p1  ORF type:complete len:398 (+),score=70.66 c20164_g1_i3:485-1678(+)